MLLLSLLTSAIQNVVGIKTCSQVNFLQDIINLTNNEVSRIILLCPFKISSQKSIDIRKSNISIVCFKGTDDDTCEFNGTQRHITVRGDNVSFVGFDFNNSEKGAVEVKGKGTSFIDCSFRE